jgi:hypothetical protein
MIEPEVPTRSGTTADWAAATAPILGVGELGIDLTLGIVKIGDGTTAFAGLPTQGGGRVVTGVATLVGGTVTVAVPGVTATSTVHATTKTLGTVTVASAFRAVPSANQIILTASQPTDTSVVAWSVIV